MIENTITNYGPARVRGRGGAVGPGRKEPAMNLTRTRPSPPTPRLPDASAPSMLRSMAALLPRRLGMQRETDVAGGHYSCGDYLKYLTD